MKLNKLFSVSLVLVSIFASACGKATSNIDGTWNLSSVKNGTTTTSINELRNQIASELTRAATVGINQAQATSIAQSYNVQLQIQNTTGNYTVSLTNCSASFPITLSYNNDQVTIASTGGQPKLAGSACETLGSTLKDLAPNTQKSSYKFSLNGNTLTLSDDKGSATFTK